MTTEDRYTTGTPTMAGRSPEYADGLTAEQARGDVAHDVINDETGSLISADKVVGTAVYDAAGERLGTIDSIMVGKRSGQVAYAVMSFGGFLGIGERYHPLPWDALTYDHDKGGYNVQHTADELRSGPNYSRDEVDTLDYSSRAGEIDSYYGVDVGAGHYAGATTDTSRGEKLTPHTTGIEAADAVGSTTGAGSTGMGSTAMGANRNF